MNFRKIIAIFAIIFCVSLGASAQKVGIKTNLISDAATTPNLGLEFRMHPKWTFDFSGQLNAWNIHERRWRHWMVQPEFRYWFCETFQGSFIGFHALGGQYNVGNINANFKFLGTDFAQLKDHRFQGWDVGAGVLYGYAWMLGKHWNMEAVIGVGWIRLWYDKFPCTVCGTKEASGRHDYFGPTKLSLAIEYLF